LVEFPDGEGWRVWLKRDSEDLGKTDGRVERL
jgi:hypothetical protein